MTRRLLAAGLLALLWTPAAGATSYLCFGDSITYGDAGRSNDAYLDRLGNYLSAEVGPTDMVNAGRRGETTVEGAARLPALVQSRSYDYVLIMEGTNDIFRWVLDPSTVDPARTRSALRSMVSDAKASGATVILATIPPVVGGSFDPRNNLTRQLNDIVRDVAGAERVAVAEVWDNLLPRANPSIYKDTLHPNEYGYPLVAEAFAAAIRGVTVASLDITPPLPERVYPVPHTRNASIETDVYIGVSEDKHPIDPSLARLTVDDVVVTPQIDTTSFPGETLFVYRFTNPLRFGQTVYVELDVSDTSVPPNRLLYRYDFSTSAGNGTGGDIDRSGRVDGLDLALLADAFGVGSSDPRYSYDADIDANGTVDGLDLMLLASRFGGPP